MKCFNPIDYGRFDLDNSQYGWFPYFTNTPNIKVHNSAGFSFTDARTYSKNYAPVVVELRKDKNCKYVLCKDVIYAQYEQISVEEPSVGLTISLGRIKNIKDVEVPGIPFDINSLNSKDEAVFLMYNKKELRLSLSDSLYVTTLPSYDFMGHQLSNIKVLTNPSKKGQYIDSAFYKSDYGFYGFVLNNGEQWYLGQ